MRNLVLFLMAGMILGVVIPVLLNLPVTHSEPVKQRSVAGSKLAASPLPLIPECPKHRRFPK